MSDRTHAKRVDALVRRSRIYAAQIPRAVLRHGTKAHHYLSEPPLLVNSFPKSGTHLLIEILRTVPGKRYFGTFIASTPPFTLRELSNYEHSAKVARLVPGEIVGAHLFHSQQVVDDLRAKSCVHFFLYRDLRDVVVSEAHYLTNMSLWHRLHSHFATTLTTNDDRISALIEGIIEPSKGIHYPDIATRFSRYRGWLDDNSVHSIRFEDLVGNRLEIIAQLSGILRAHRPSPEDTSVSSTAMAAAYDPSRSRTFRRGVSGTWRTAFTSTHRKQMKDVAGPLLIELGYERDLDW